jgi:hypothetical protein
MDISLVPSEKWRLLDGGRIRVLETMVPETRV